MNVAQDFIEPLPATAEDASDEIASLSGDIVSLQQAINLHWDRHNAGMEVDWDWHTRARTKLGYMRGELSTLRLHRKTLLAERRRLDRLSRADKAAANLAMQAEIAEKAAHRKAANIAKAANEHRLAVIALKKFIADNWPDRLQDAWAVIDAAKEAAEQERRKE